jgi:chloramphenicol 3-O-phosphotransferase
MINVCEHCGQYRNDKIVDRENSCIICPECGYKKAYKLLPLFMVSGASCSGKSTICNYLAGKSNDFMALDMDILWAKHFDQPENNYKPFFETWLRMAKNIAQAGMPVVLFGAGCIPNNVESCIEKRYFSKIHYLGLVCSDDILEKRLHNRPKWRNSSNNDFIINQIGYNNFLKLNKEINTIETDNTTIKDVSERIKNWVDQRNPRINSI